MALTRGQQWALYLLTVQHDDGLDVHNQQQFSKTQFRVDVEANSPANGPYQNGFVIAAQAEFDPDITQADFGPTLPTLYGPDVRTFLGLTTPYPPQSGPCPRLEAGQAIYKHLAGRPDYAPEPTPTVGHKPKGVNAPAKPK